MAIQDKQGVQILDFLPPEGLIRIRALGDTADRLRIMADGSIRTGNGAVDPVALPPTGGLLASVFYNPGTAVNNAVTSATYVDVDATNLAITFVVPLSGKVVASLSATCSVVSNNTLGWGLRNGTTDVSVSDILYNGASGTVNIASTRRYGVSGLTPGATLTWKWSHARTFGAGTDGTTYGGGSGPAVMEVQSA